MKRAVYAASAIAVLAVAGMGAALWYAASGRLAGRLRSGLVSQIERATGGRVEIGAFRLHWRTLDAELDHFVLHGTEPAGAAPLFSANRIAVRFQIASVLERKIDLARLFVDRPSSHIIIAADGSSNLPRPKAALAGARDVLDLNIGSFDARNGIFSAEVNGHSASQPWSAHGENLLAHFDYDPAASRYTGRVSLSPLHVASATLGGIDLNTKADLIVDRNQIRLTSAELKTAHSEVRLSNVSIRNPRAPVVSSHYEARLSLAEFTPNRGDIATSGNFRFASPADYSVTGAFSASRIDFPPFHDTRVSAKFTALPDRIAITDARAHVAEGEISGSGEIRELRDFVVRGRVDRFSSRRLMEIATHEITPYNAWLSGTVEASGKLRELAQRHFIASARLTATPAPCSKCIPMAGEIQAKYDGFTEALDLRPSTITLPSSRATVSGIPGNHLNIDLETRNLADIEPLIGKVPSIQLRGGAVRFTGTVTGRIADPAIAGHIHLTRAAVNGEPIDSFSGDIAARRSSMSVQNGAAAEGALRARVSGSLALNNWAPRDSSALDATIQVSGADVKKLLAMAGGKDIDFTGAGTANAHVTGSFAEPHLDATLALSHGAVYSQPYDALTARLQYAGAGAQLLNISIASGAKKFTAYARFDRRPGAAPLNGAITFNAQSNGVPLDQIVFVHAREPALRAAAQFHAAGSVRVSRDASGHFAFDLVNLNGMASASGIELQGRKLGDARLTTETNGNVLTARFDSDAAKAAIHGSATVRLERDYPMSASMTFSRANLNAFAMLLMAPHAAGKLNLDGAAAGEMQIRGPIANWSKWTGAISLPEIEIHPVAAPGNCGTESTCAGIRGYSLRNQGPVRLALANGGVAVQAARFVGPQTDVTLSGSMGFSERAGYNLRAAGDVDLALAAGFSTGYETSGMMHIDAALRGAPASPDLSGRMEIRKGAVRYTGFPNGIQNVNAALAFNGNRATIQSFTAESGGGRVDVGGFAALTAGLVAFRLDVRTSAVRMRFPEGVSVISDSHITVAGTSDRSEAAGTVTIHRVTVNPRADFSTIFARSAQPVKIPTVQAGLLSNVNLDVQIETAPDVALETSMAQRIDANASLRLRGTATNPDLLGRVNITSGELMFFGNKYTITTGSISFLNPSRIDPILNVDLETRARGVDVILTIAGPLTKPGVTYRSDPPLQFSDIVALLATGRTPLDPGLPGGTVGQQQSFAQLGASQLVGEAIQTPSNSRLQRFFGVSKVKIDPQLTDVTGSPESRLTVEQQVSPDILFTYITDVSSTSTQLIRVEWALNKNWSAIVTREENGYVGLDFAFRKTFK